MTGADLVGFTGFAEFFLRVLAHRLQQPVTHADAGVVGDHQGFVDEQAELVQQLIALDVAAGADRLGGVEIEPAGEAPRAGGTRPARAR